MRWTLVTYCTAAKPAAWWSPLFMCSIQWIPNHPMHPTGRCGSRVAQHAVRTYERTNMRGPKGNMFGSSQHALSPTQPCRKPPLAPSTTARIFPRQRGFDLDSEHVKLTPRPKYKTYEARRSCHLNAIYF